MDKDDYCVIKIKNLGEAPVQISSASLTSYLTRKAKIVNIVPEIQNKETHRRRFTLSPFGFNLILASPSTEDLRGVDISKLKDNLENLRGGFDFILLDSAPGVGREV